MALQGKFRLELAREKKVTNRVKREVVKRIEQKNTITGFSDGVLNEGDYGLLIPNSKLMPVKQFFDGCVLTDKVNNSSVGMIAHDANITACAGNSAYSGTYMKRGSFSQESAVISSPNGYKGYSFVFDWSTDRGNGTIASLGLTRSQLAISEYFNDGTVPATGAEMMEILYDYGIMTADGSYLGGLHIVDYESEMGYKVRYSSNTIYIDKYQLSCKNVHLLTRPFLCDKTDDYHPEYIGTEEIAQSVANFNDNSSSISYTGDKIVIITWSGSAIKAYPITISNWSIGTVVEKTFNGVTFTTNINTYSSTPYHKDVVLLDGTDAWISATTGGVLKMLKIDLLGATTDVKAEKTIPFSVDGYRNCCSVMMPNGDFYKFPYVDSPQTHDAYACLYYHNGEFYRAIIPTTYWKSGNASSMAGVNSNAYGTSLINFGDMSGTGSLLITAMHGWLSTISDLSEPVIKSADLTMKLTYEITELAPSP